MQYTYIDTVTEIGSQSIISDPVGWDVLQDDNVLMTPGGDKQYNELRKKLRLAQDETLR